MLNQCHFGDCREVLHRLAGEGLQAQTCITSPPYWGLRDYGHPGQLGLEPVVDCFGWATGEPCGECFICHMVDVFRGVREVLADDGTLWLNMGDGYAQAGGPGWQGKHGQRADRRFTLVRDTVPMRAITRRPPAGLKPKDLIGQPWRLAFALQADGWWLRQDIIWHKPNPMPESILDRCTKAHEYVFLLAKSERYFYDADAIKEQCSDNTHPRRAGNGYKTPDGWDTSKGDGAHGSFHKNGREKGRAAHQPERHLPGNKTRKGATAYENGAEEHRTKAGLVKYSEKMRKLAESGSGTKNNTSMDAALSVMPETRNKRDVWTVPSQPFSGAHFATFPPALIEPCIIAGSRIGDVVLDPFFGSGTTGMVAERLGRRWVGVEINEDYAPLQAERLSQRWLAL